MQSTSDALPLVHEGWDHLKHERPLAAWASWQRALRVDADQPAARQALDRLAGSPELPATARKEYRFRTPADPARRARWDAAFRGRDLSDLTEAASAFAALAADDPTDPDAPYNQALCLAWLGRNVEAIEALDRSVRAGAAGDFDAAASVWTLAGVLRQGGGAEERADEFSYAIEIPGPLPAAFARNVVLRRLPTPGEPAHDHVTVDEWLDRDWPEDHGGPLHLDDVPRVVAIVLSTGRSVRFSATSPEGIDTVALALRRLGLDPPSPVRTPLPVSRLDAAAWSIRLPTWVDEETRHRIYRENVEDFFENRWDMRQRRGLGDFSPFAAASGDAAARAKLEGTVRLFEELAARPAAVELYQGYPFDRLRRRLGLVPRDPETIDETEVATMSGADLERLDPTMLDDHALVDAFRSSLAFADDARTAPFAERLIATNSPSLARLDLQQVFGPLVRRAAGRPEEAMRWVDEALAADAAHRGGRYRQLFTMWRADALARLGQPEHAEVTFRDVVDRSAWAATVALMGAESLLDNGHEQQGRRLAALARDLALEHGDAATAREAGALLDRFEP
jgi:tetratricopeptide (TPR) repeat protein